MEEQEDNQSTVLFQASTAFYISTLQYYKSTVKNEVSYYYHLNVVCCGGKYNFEYHTLFLIDLSAACPYLTT